jgi:hypothetical protein
VDLTIVKQVLLERGIQPIMPLETPRVTDSLLPYLRTEIKRADLILAILTPESPTQNVLFEIGCAYGLQKQLLIMAPHGVTLPTDIQELQYIRADAQNREALSFAIDQALAPKKPSSQRKTAIEKTRALGDSVKSLLERLRAHPAPRERELLAIVADALKQSGALTVAEHGPQEFGYDIAVWADELGPWVGNPLLIEIKARIPHPGNAIDQILARLQPEPTRWALLLYHQGNPVPVQKQSTIPTLLVLSI